MAAQPTWASGYAFGNADFADEGQIRFTKAAVRQNGRVPAMLVVNNKDQPTNTLILRSVIESGEADAPIYLAPKDYDALKPADLDEGDHAEQRPAIPLEFRKACRREAIFHKKNRGALVDAVITFASAVLLAGCALTNVWFSRRVDTSAAIFPIAVFVAVVTIAAGSWKVWRDVGKLYK